MSGFVAGPGFDALPLPALIIDGAGRVVALNDAAESWLNLSRRAALGQPLQGEAMQARLRTEPPLAELLARLSAGRAGLSQPLMRFDLGDRQGGHLSRHGDVWIGPAPDNLPGGAVVLVTPRDAAGLNPGHAARAAARQAIGMAEMLAHEIKNPLAGIRGAAQLLSMNVGDEDRELTDLIVAESRSIVALLDQVERFGDTTPPAIVPVNLHDVLERARRSATLGFAQGLRIVTDYDPSLPQALGDYDQLVQVMLNLMRNAAEAMGRGQGSTIRLRSYYDGALRVAGPDGPQALPLQIEVEDDGPGIPPHLAAQIFEPFVSGRENGTGLGLALISKIMADHGGWVGLESRPGRTLFRLSFARA
ncbi:MAG: ATP-binding protein [Paracoccus sp. (in: a-proteobacteria)]|nr:ATP-binding protein [Paracoccus sp. (in: a-proteobacteria)]